ncbi:MAG TPA: DUF3175 domain-containing protein [Thermoanaerobaculia bacterium]|jgi:hypothetical protein
MKAAMRGCIVGGSVITGLGISFVLNNFVASGKYWSRRVTENSDALDLERGVFAKQDPRAIARSLKRSAERSRRRKSSSYRSAMSMLTFYVNRAGKNLSKTRLAKLEKAKDELRALYGKPRRR